MAEDNVSLITEETTQSVSVERETVFCSSVHTQSYKFSVKHQCLSGPPPAVGRWSFLGYVAQKDKIFSHISSTSLPIFTTLFRLGGNFCYEPEDLLDSQGVCSLSETTQDILRHRVFHDLNPQDIVDYHCHLVGHGDSGSECYLHASTQSWWYPLRRFKTAIFMGASQVTEREGGDIQYISRLIRLINHFVPASVLNPPGTGYKHGKYCMLPFDKFYDPETGQDDLNRTTFYVPNEYSLQLAHELPDLFYPVGSVNPYRPDALSMLQYLNENGVTIIKWLPNSMGIDPSDEKCVPFYKKMKELDMVLLVHCGDEHSVNAGFIDNRLGNPLLLRQPLNCGLKVITAHCATEGYATDFDNNNVSVPCFDLWLRLMRDDQYKGLLYGDISAVCAVLRVSYLQQLIQATDIHDRLVYGSDYPVPAINLVVHTSRLQRFGLITGEERVALNELYHYNPLLFDVASKRLLRGPNNETFPAALFKAHTDLPPVKHSKSKFYKLFFVNLFLSISKL